ncbi:hypothetical protein ACQJBY_034988 [Aegilops geniculata]
MPPRFWAEALNTSTYLINRRPCRASAPCTPHELLLGVAPDYSQLRVFGCLCYPNITATTRHKLEPRSLACVFLGYPSDHRGFRCFDPVSRRVLTSRHVLFHENVFPFSTPPPAPSPMQPASPASSHVLQVPLVIRSRGVPALSPGSSSAVGSSSDASASPAPSAPSTHSSSAVGSSMAGSSSPTAASRSTSLAAPSTTRSSATSSSSTSASPSTGGAGLSINRVASPALPAPPVAPPAPMVTRAQRGIFRPNPRYYHAAAASTSPSSTSSTVSPVPNSVRTAVRDPHWLAAIV